MTPEQEALILSVQPLAWFIAGRSRLQPPLSREDLAQAGLAELCRTIDSYDETHPFAPWAGTVMGNAMRRENESMTWRRQSASPLVRSVSTRSHAAMHLLLEYGYGQPVVGDSGSAAPPREALACAVCGAELTGRQTVTCSRRCQDSRYKRRTRARVPLYGVLSVSQH